MSDASAALTRQIQGEVLANRLRWQGRWASELAALSGLERAPHEAMLRAYQDETDALARELGVSR